MEPNAYQNNFFRSYHKFFHQSWSNFIFRISTKHQLQNLNQTSAFRLNLNFKVLTKHSLRISTKIKLHNLQQASPAKYWPNFSLKISPKLQLQNLDQTFCSKYEQKFDFITKLQLPNLHQTVINTFLCINFSNSNNLKKLGLTSSHARFTSIKSTRQEWVSACSDSLTDKGSQWLDSVPIKWKVFFIPLDLDISSCLQCKKEKRKKQRDAKRSVEKDWLLPGQEQACTYIFRVKSV